MIMKLNALASTTITQGRKDLTGVRESVFSGHLKYTL